MAFTIERAIKWWFRDKPDHPAIWYDGETLTFGELHDWSARVAAALEADGVQRGDRVAVVAQNSLEYAVLLVATMLTGAIANPITFRSSARELTRSLSITEPKLVFSDADRAATVSEALGNADGTRHRALGLVASLRTGPVVPLPQFEAAADDPIFIIGTSGSTGFPKGVVYSHGATMIYAAEFTLMQPACGHGGGALVTGPYSSSSGTLLLFQFLAAGATVYSTSHFTPETALEMLRTYPISTFLAATIFFERIAALPEFENANLSTVAFAQIGGARVSAELLARYRDKGVILRQAYGCTEAGGAWAARDETALTEPHKCGAGAMFSRFKVVLPDGTEAESGEPGEILVQSDALATGYWNDEEQTAATFRDGWLHTGDRGIVDKRGNLTFIDRMKDIIISGGLNISAMEVENVIAELPEIGEVVVIAVPDEQFGETPLAIVHGETLRIEPGRIVEHCRKELASYKVPRYVSIEPEELPRLPSGKIDRTGLRARFADAPSFLEKVR